MERIIQALILTGIEAVCCNIFFSTFMEKRFQKKHWLNNFLLVLFSFLLLMISVVQPERYFLKAFCSIAVMALIMLTMHRAGIRQIIFSSICYYGILMAVDSGIVIIIQYVLNYNLEEVLQSNLMATVLGVLCKSVLFLIVAIINRKFSREEDYGVLADSEWIRFLFFPVFTVSAVLLFLVDGKNGERSMLLISFGLLAANFILFYLIKDFVRREKENRQLCLMQEHARSQMELYENMKGTYEEQRTRVHEFKNHVDCIQGMLLEGQEAKVIEYIAGLNEDMESHMNYFNTANSVVNAVVNQKYRQAKERDIALVMVLDDLSYVKMQEEDLVVLLANLLNNAIEACEHLKEEQRLIKFKFAKEKGRTVISIKNPIKEPVKIVNNQIRTIKENKQEHGIGMQNIKYVIEKYKGEGICTSCNGYFSYIIVFETL